MFCVVVFAIASASEVTHTVSGGALNSTQSNPIFAIAALFVRAF